MFYVETEWGLLRYYSLPQLRPALPYTLKTTHSASRNPDFDISPFGFFDVKCAKSRTSRNHRKHQKTNRKDYRSQLTLNVGERYRVSR